MSRVKRGNVARKSRKKVFALAKGFRGASSKLYRPAHQAVLNALTHAYKDRRLKKRDFRGLWITRINAALDILGVSYSKFTGNLKKNNINLNRKVLSELAIQEPQIFQKIVEVSK